MTFERLIGRKINYIFCLSLVFFSFQGIAQVTAVTTLSPSGPYCAGASVSVTFTASGYTASNNFTAQLSDNTGSFASPVTIGTLTNTTSGGTISATLPLNSLAGTNTYRIRVIGSNPSAGTPTASSTFTINAIGLNAPTGLSTQCAGATFNITNNLTNSCSFGSGNSFTVQLSDASGSFTSTTTIGTATNTTSGGAISVTLPNTLTTSNNYRIRIVGSNPAVTSTQSATFTINGLTINAPTVSTSICQGTTFNITNNVSNACAIGTGNIFTVQLSDQFGSFASPTVVGSLAAVAGGTISVTIPQNQTTGTSYLMRVVSSNPAVVGTSSAALTINSPAINAPTGLSTRCAGSTFNVTNNISSCSFFAGNTFKVQLSDASGSFASPTDISAAVSATTGGTISVTLPSTATTSSNYQVQIVSTNPAITSSPSAAFTINGFGLNAPTISGGATSFCQGQNITISYTLANSCTFPNTPSNNVFSAQLSDAFGSFASPTTIGTVTSNTSGTISANIGNPAAGTGYRIRIVSSNPGSGVISADNGTDLSIAATSGNPATFGNGVWNAYVYNSNTIAGFTNYAGFYSFSGLSFDTGTQYGTTSSPTAASGYAGCSVVGNTNYGISFKRTNFTCGYYQIDIPYQDDQAAIYINGSLVFQNTTFTGTAQTNVWRGFLNASSTVEIRFVNGLSAGQLQLNLSSAANPLTVSPNITQCSSPTNPGTLSVTSSVPLTFVWSPNGTGSGLTPSSGVGSSVTAAPSATTTYTVTGTDATTSCTVTANVTVTVSNAKPTLTVTNVPSTICSGIVTSTLTVSGATNYTWTPTTGLTPSSGIGYTMNANPSSTTTYTVTGDNGCTGVANSNTATTTVTVQNVPTSPLTTVFGNNTWNVYCHYNNTTLSNFYGYYTENNLSFNTTSRWGNTAGPSVANGSSGTPYTGCTFQSTGTNTCGTNVLNYTNYSMSFKRTNFTCGYYQIDVNYQDDYFTLLVDGVQVFQNNAYTPSLQSNVWTGFLGPSTQVEMRLVNNCGPGQLQVTISPSTNYPQTISPDVTICAGTTTSLTASASAYPGATFAWSISPTTDITFNPGTNVANTILQTTASTPAQNYTLTSTMTDAGTGRTGCTATATRTITVNPLPSTAVTPTATATYCPSGGIVLTATGANTYVWNPTTGLSAGTGYQVTATPTTTTTYTVTGSNNCAANSASTTITVLPLPAITTFPSGTWNVYGFNSQTIGTNYQGYYTENGSGSSGYDFNTTTRWASGAAPSTANATSGNAWLGCNMNTTNISLSFKRTGFTCGVYQINIPSHDDYFYLIINGTTVAQHVGCCDSHTNVWTGVLGPSSQVELQLMQGVGGSGLNVTFTPISQPAGTNIWIGGTSNDWFTSSNWCSAVPTSTTDALIPAAGPANMPAIANTGALVRNITINPAIAAGTYNAAIPAASLTTSGSNNLDVYGIWTNNGTLTPNTGSITFRGSSSNTITSSGSETFYNLIINNSNGVTISSGTHQVSNQMTFTSGIVTQNATLNILNGASVSGASNSSYVSGPVTKIGNSAFTFPVGSGGSYRPIGIAAPSSATDAFTARYFNSNPNASYPVAQFAPTLDHVSVMEYWFLNRTTGSSNVNVTLSWNANSYVNNLGVLRVARWDVTASRWQDQGNGSTTGTNSAGTITTSSAVNTFSTPNSPFTLASINAWNPLPVQLVSFACSGQSNGVKLVWTTASEVNNDHFDIERSGDGIEFKKIVTIKGNGTSNELHHYSFFDQAPLAGTSYYRLRQIDLDGTDHVFDVCSVQTDAVGPQVEIYPNPASNQASIEYKNIGKITELKVINSVGAEVPTPYKLADESIQLNISAHISGVYIVEIKSDEGIIYRGKLMIVK